MWALAVISSWSIGGLFFSLGPSLSASLFDSSDHLVAGIGVFRRGYVVGSGNVDIPNACTICGSDLHLYHGYMAGMEAGYQLIRAHDVHDTVQARNVWRGLRDAALTDFSELPEG